TRVPRSGGVFDSSWRQHAHFRPHHSRSRRDGGKPCIRGLRISVGTILGLLASGHTEAEILKAYPYLESEDIQAVLGYELLADTAEEIESLFAVQAEALLEE